MFARIQLLRGAIPVLVCAASIVTMPTAMADVDDELEIPPICLKKPWLPVCDPPTEPGPGPIGPFPCDLTEPGCPWWPFP